MIKSYDRTQQRIIFEQSLIKRNQDKFKYLIHLLQIGVPPQALRQIGYPSTTITTATAFLKRYRQLR